MATPPSIRQITREALGDAPAWVDKLLQPLNAFLQQTVDALSQGLTPSQNFAQCWVTVKLTDGVMPPPQALPALKGKVPKGVSVEAATFTFGTPEGVPLVDWGVTAVDGKPGLLIRRVTGIQENAQVTLTLLVKAE